MKSLHGVARVDLGAPIVLAGVIVNRHQLLMLGQREGVGLSARLPSDFLHLGEH